MGRFSPYQRRHFASNNIIPFVLSLAAGGKGKGVDIKLGEFFTTAYRAKLWSQLEFVHRSAISKARNKISWTAFKGLFLDAVTTLMVIARILSVYQRKQGETTIL